MNPSDENEPPNPWRLGGPTDPSRRREPKEPIEEASTFRPNPVGSVPGGRPQESKPPGRKSGGGLGGTRYAEGFAKAYEKPASGPTLWERILFGRVSTGQLAQFCRQFGTYLAAGVDFIKALSSLERQFAGTALGPILNRVQTAVRRGSTLEEAMAAEPGAFGPMFLSMIKVAEARGGVPETLRMLSHHYESRLRLIRQARTAMIYPVIVMIIACAVVALITIFLLPKFAEILQSIAGKSELPFASQVLMGISHFVRSMGWWLIPLVMIATPIVLIYCYKTNAGKWTMDRIALRIPVLGKLCRMLDTTRFARTLSVLLDSGVDVGSSIDLTADVLRMNPIRAAVRSTRQEIMGGRELSSTLDRTRQFSPDVIAVIASGEETGKLPESLAHLADDYDEQVSVMVASLSHLLQPLMIVVLGAIVLFILLAVFLPIIQLMTTLAAPV
jgi:type IV pilus assembly protein PilC